MHDALRDPKASPPPALSRSAAGGPARRPPWRSRDATSQSRRPRPSPTKVRRWARRGKTSRSWASRWTWLGSMATVLPVTQRPQLVPSLPLQIASHTDHLTTPPDQAALSARSLRDSQDRSCARYPRQSGRCDAPHVGPKEVPAPGTCDRLTESGGLGGVGRPHHRGLFPSPKCRDARNIDGPPADYFDDSGDFVGRP